MFKRLVSDDYETYTKTGEALAESAKTKLEPIIEYLIDEGYATVDIQHILLEEISVMICEKRLDRNVTLRRKNAKTCY
jgi:hypothetical protein